MQRQLDADSITVSIQILGVNGAGYEAGNAEICANRVLPWLQETALDSVWTEWAVVYRDVVILDGLNRPIAVFNLTEHNLAEPAKYDSLKNLLLESAQ